LRSLHLASLVVFVFCIAPLIAGCPERICDPGKSESCACPSGENGAQVCLDDGSAWGECECVPADDDDDSAGDDDDSAGDDDDATPGDDDDATPGDDDDSVGDDDDATPTDDDDDTTEPPLNLHFGTWTYGQTGVATDGCGFFTQFGPLQDDGPMDITDDGGGQFTLSPLRGDDATCSLSDHNFVCDSRMTYQENLMGLGLDAVVAIHATSTGVFPTDTTMSGNHNGTASCAGTQCAEVEALIAGTFPCTVGVHFTATFP